MTVRFKNELVRNITIKLGYANAKVRLAVLTFICILELDFDLRSTNARTKRARDRAAIARTLRIKRKTHYASGQDVAIG